MNCCLWLNGVKIRHAGEIRDNFDAVSLRGYFLGGSLVPWLNSNGGGKEAARLALTSGVDLTLRLQYAFGLIESIPDVKEQDHPTNHPETVTPVIAAKPMICSYNLGSFGLGSFGSFGGFGYGSFGLGSFGGFGSFGLGSYSFGLGSYSFGLGSYSFGLGSYSFGSYGFGYGQGSYAFAHYGFGSYSFGSYNFGSAESFGNIESFRNIGSFGNVGSFGNIGSFGNVGSFGNIGSFGSHVEHIKHIEQVFSHYDATRAWVESFLYYQPLNRLGYGIHII